MDTELEPVAAEAAAGTATSMSPAPAEPSEAPMTEPGPVVLSDAMCGVFCSIGADKRTA